jgi:hypothetical protein
MEKRTRNLPSPGDGLRRGEANPSFGGSVVRISDCRTKMRMIPLKR